MRDPADHGLAVSGVLGKLPVRPPDALGHHVGGERVRGQRRARKAKAVGGEGGGCIIPKELHGGTTGGDHNLHPKSCGERNRHGGAGGVRLDAGLEHRQKVRRVAVAREEVVLGGRERARSGKRQRLLRTVDRDAKVEARCREAEASN